MASDLGLHCLHMTLLRVPGKNGLIKIMHPLASLLLPCLAEYVSKCGSELNVRCLPRPAHHILLSFFFCSSDAEKASSRKHTSAVLSKMLRLSSRGCNSIRFESLLKHYMQIFIMSATYVQFQNTH